MFRISNILLSAGILLGITTTTTYSQKEHSCSQKSQFAQFKSLALSNKSANSRDYDVNFYKLDLHVERNTTFIEGNVTISASVSSANLDTFTCELHSNHTIDSIYLNGVKHGSFVRAGNIVQVPFGSSFSQSTQFNTTIFYHGTAPSGGSAAIGEGFSTGSSPSWGNEVTWSLSQPYSAYEWFPVKQDLNDKADSVEVWITTDPANKAGSNGILENITTLPSGKKRYEWKSRYPISYYLISVAVAKYVDYTFYAMPSGQSDSIKIVNYIYDNPQTLPNFKAEIDKTKNMIELYSEIFGMYPFYKEKYGHCMAPFSGGMEHQTMTSQGFFTTDLTSHELAHQWFGDDVTCASWRDISMNEGFASYLEYVFIQNFEPTRARSWIDDTHGAALVPTGSVYVDDTTSVGRIFSSSLSYNKGAMLLHMLRYEINNDSIFYNGLKNYRLIYSGKNVTGLQFKKEMENYTSKDFTDFFDQWYFGQGYPTFNISYNQTNGNVYLKVDQIASAPSVTPLFKTHLDVRLLLSGVPDTVLRLNIDQASQTFVIPDIAGNLVTLLVDPDQWLLNGEGSISRNSQLGIESISNTDVSIYPNPTSGEVNVQFPNHCNDCRVEVFSEQGQLVFEGRGDNENHCSFQLEGASGMYLLRILASSGVMKEVKILKE